MTQTNELLDHIDEALEQAGLAFSAEECHGTLIGMLCTDSGMALEAWLAYLNESRETDSAMQSEIAETFRTLYTISREQLNDSVLDFHPLLPDDNDKLEDRIEALALWCQGFLFGLSVSGKIEMEKLPDDSNEILRDILEISRAGSLELEGGEEDEDSYHHLLEYVRAGVLLINEELNPSRAPPRENVTLH